MAIIFNKVARHNPSNPGEVKYYAATKTIKLVDEREVAKMIADETTLNPKEAEMTLEQLKKVVLRLLKDSYSVRLGDWISFHVGLSSTGVDKIEDVSAKQIKGVHLNTRLSKEFKEELNRATFMSEEVLRSKKKV